MSFGIFAPPPPSPEKICPMCGQVMSDNAKMCWLCLKEFSTSAAISKQDANDGNIAESAIQAELPKRPVLDPSASLEQDGSGVAVVWVGIGFLVVSISSVLAFEAPGVLCMLMGLTALAAPGLILMALSGRAAEGERASAPSTVWIGLGGIGIVALVGLTGFIAMFVICMSSSQTGR